MHATETHHGTADNGEKIRITNKVNVTEEEDVTLNCTTSKEAASPKWSRKDGDAVPTQSRVLKDKETRLRITSASVLDAGIFNCESEKIIHTFIVRVKVLVKVEMVIKVLNYQYTPELQNKSSKVFEETAKNFTKEMDEVYKNTPGYVRTEVLNFTKGSVKVDFRVIIIIVATDPKNESTITDKKAETGLRIIDEAKNGVVERLKVSPDVEVKAPPPDPRNVEIFDVKSDELSVRWIPPKDVKYFDVYEYKVEHRRFQTKDVSTSDIPASEGRDKYSYRIQNLQPETTYIISVAAVNEYGSNFNEESGHRTLEPPLAIWIILLIVLGVIILIAIIIGGIVCFRRRAAERRRRQAEERALEGFGNPKELDSVLQYEKKKGKGLKFSFVNDSYKPSGVNWTEIPYENINLMDELGSGAFGVVYRGEIIREEDDVTPCAVKAVQASASHEEIRDLYNELEIMTNVGYHPNLVNLLGACTKDGNLLVVLEIAENGSLLDFLKKSRNGNENYEGEGVKRGGLTEDMKLMIATDVAKGMAYLASHRCIHRDLAARNVLLAENYVAKVADYGMARDVYESLMYKKETQGKLPVKWMAIESLETYVFTVESDIWSYGVLLWEIESGGLKPYAGMTTPEIMTELKKGYRLEKPSGCSDAMYQVMRDCWNPNPKLRPSFEKLVERLEAMV
ncbi:angiopoietin-1 receptor-like isoform X2 [Montipora capricornis]|uniref:angiopoietin-1 receptor-like isoform X2 n=1 Tax=Montipora capricornis TaxID=246305 RepID=UPI0035F17E17